MTPEAQTIDSVCPVCSKPAGRFFARASDVEYYSTNDVYTYLSCSECGSVFLDQPPVNELRTIYPRNYYSYGANGHKASLVDQVKERLDARQFARILRRIPGDQLRILDIGGGSGASLSLLRRISPRVKETHEVDIDEGARQRAEGAGHTFHLCKAEDFAPANKFNLILMLNLIEHVADPARVLRSIGQLLTPGGLMLIKTPNVETLDCRIFRNHNWGGYHCPRHFVLFNLSSITSLGKSCGLEVEESAYTQGAPQWACSILGWMGLKRWIRISREHPLYTHPLYPAVCAAAAAFDFARAPFAATAQMFVLFAKQKITE